MSTKNLQSYAMRIALSMMLLSGYAAAQAATVSGTVFLPSGAAPLPANSWMTVEVKDESVQNAPATPLAKTVVPLPEGSTGSYEYLIENVQLDQTGDASISAVVNIGWKPSDETWIRSGDYLSDIPAHLQLPPANPMIKAPDLQLIKY